nr:glycosyltransferase [Gemmatimonadales bacterium]
LLPREAELIEWADVMFTGGPSLYEAKRDRHPNILYTGQRSYGELPAYLAGWDVCLLPFAQNDATRFISPTKILEYMVAEQPIVSTPITDVARPYGDIVYLAGTPDQFVDACETALASGRPERERRATRMREVLARTSWDATAAAMDRLIEHALGSAGPLENQMIDDDLAAAARQN